MTTKHHNNSIAWVAFDAVGTILHPVPNVLDVYLTSAVEFGSRLTKLEIAQRLKQHMQRGPDASHVVTSFEHDDHVTSEAIEFAYWRDLVNVVLNDTNDPEGCFRFLWQHFASPAAWVLADAFSDIFGELKRRGLRLAIASNFDGRLRTVLAALLDQAGLASPDAIVISSEVGFRKPDWRFYNALIQACGVSPDRVLMVGDDRVNDYDAAIHAGLKSLLLTTPLTTEKLLLRLTDGA
jgi:putative hydrolase of the HAD superfamily